MDEQVIPGTLKPAAVAVLDILEAARGRRMSADKIFEKLAAAGFRWRTSQLLWDLQALGLVRRDTNAGNPRRHAWRLETQLAVRP
jgi:DNA-binding IclR family transcriptional regulator